MTSETTGGSTQPPQMPYRRRREDGNHPLMERLADNVYSRFARAVVLPLITVILIPMIVWQWQAVRDDIRDIKAQQAASVAERAQLSQRIAIIDTKLDAGLIWRLTQLEQRFDALQARMDARAGAAETP
jgi:hypothetical protein